MPHYSCMSGQQLTRDEELRFTHWIVESTENRPKDFTVTEYGLRDNKTGVSVSVDGWNLVRITAPQVTMPFRIGNGRRICNAAHRIRHMNGSPASSAIRSVIEQEPVARDRTSGEVAKLRRLVNAAKRPEAVVAIALLAITAASAYAFG